MVKFLIPLVILYAIISVFLGAKELGWQEPDQTITNMYRRETMLNIDLIEYQRKKRLKHDSLDIRPR